MFEEAETILVCRKVYKGTILKEGFIDKGILKQNYEKEGFHRYVYRRVREGSEAREVRNLNIIMDLK